MTQAIDVFPLEMAKSQFEKIIRENGLSDSDISVLVKTLSPEEAIGVPGRRDFPIVEGKERVVEADFQGAKAHAFTDAPKEFIGKLKDVIAMPLADSGRRAIFIATMNAVLKHSKIIETTLHCKNEEPEQCAVEIASHICNTLGSKKVGLIGLNPAILEALSRTFGSENIRITDLNRENIGSVKYGVHVWDGITMTEKLVQESDIVLMTGTTLVNGTFERIWSAVRQYDKDYLVYGVTSAGVCSLTGLNRICPYGRK
jgi:uncharacterized protein (DUF4213/DUF364 family)